MATEFLTLRIDEKGATVVSRNIKNIGDSAVSANTKVSGFSSALRSAFGILGGTALAIKSFNTIKNFGEEMSTVKAITSATEGQFKSLRDEAKNLGATTKFTASQAAEGMSFLARAGFDANAILKSTKDTLLLAQAGALGLADAADIASNVLTAFRFDVSQTARVVDILAFQANRSNTNVLQLGEAMKFAAPISAGLGVSIEETSAAIGALSDAGLQATLAGTGLRGAMLSLVEPTAKGRETIEGLGLTMADVDVTTLGLNKVLKNLAETTFQVTDATAIAGKRGGPALEILVNSFDKVAKTSVALKDSAGFAQRVADIMGDNLAGAVNSAASAWEGFLIELSDLGPESALTNIFKALTSILRSASANIVDVGKALKVAIVTWVSYRAAILLTSESMLLFVGRIKTVVTAIFTLNTAMLATPVGWFAAIVTGVVGATYAVVNFSNKIKLTKDGVVTLEDVGKKVFSNIGDYIKSTFSKIGEYFAGIKNSFMETFAEAISSTGRFLTSWRKLFIDSIDKIIGINLGLRNVMIFIFSEIGDALRAPWEGFVTLAKSSAEKVINYFSVMAAGISSAFSIVKQSFQEAMDYIKNRLDIKLPEVKLPDVPDGAKKFGEKLQEKFIEGYNSNLLSNFLKTSSDIFTVLENQIRAEKASADANKVEPETPPASIKFEERQQNTGPKIDPERVKALQTINEQIQNEIDLLKLGNVQREVESNLLDIIYQLKEDNIELSKKEQEGIRIKLQELQLLQEQADIIDEVRGEQDRFNLSVKAYQNILREQLLTQKEVSAQIIKDNSDLFGDTTSRLLLAEDYYAKHLERVNILRQQDLISEEQAIAAKRKLDADLFEARIKDTQTFFGTLSKLSTSENKKLAAIGKAAAIVQATIDGVLAVQKALASAPPPINFALAGAVGTVAAANVAQIASQRRLGGDLREGQLTRVGEGQRPEIYKNAKGEQYMIPPERGRVEPLSGKRKENVPGAQSVEPNVNVAVNPDLKLKILNMVSGDVVEDYMNSEAGEKIVVNIFKRNQGEIFGV